MIRDQIILTIAIFMIIGLIKIIPKITPIQLSKKEKKILTIIFIISLSINFFLIPHFHKWYIDEPNILEKARVTLTGDDYSQYKYRHPMGWPLLLSVFFAIFGVSANIALYSVSFIASITTVPLYLLIKNVTNQEKVSYLGALVYTLLPVVLRYSGSAMNSIPSNFFIILSLYLIFESIHKKDKYFDILTLLVIGLTVLFRTENYLIFVIYLSSIILQNKNKLLLKLKQKVKLKLDKNTNFKIFGLVIIILLTLPNLQHNLDLYLDNNLAENNQGENSTNWGFQNLERNKQVFIDFFNGNTHPLFFTILVIVGIYFGLNNEKQKDKTHLLLMWALILIISFTMYFDVPDRFFIATYPSLIIFFTIGLYQLVTMINKPKLNYFFYIIIIALFIPGLIQESNDVWEAHNLETQIPDMIKHDLNYDCTMVAIWPTVIKATTNIKTINAEDLTNNQIKEENCMLFLEDIFCDGTFGRHPSCEELKKMYNFKEQFKYSSEYKSYSVYQLIKKN